MNCFHPVKIYLTDDARKKRESCEYMPPEWRYASYIYVPCGKCAACLSKRRSEWSFRLFQEVRNSESCYFITLTYDDEYLKYKVLEDTGCLVPIVNKRDVQLFLKRLRKSIEPFKIRYFLVSEYGPKTYRPHYHMLLFNFPCLLKSKLNDILKDAWGNGFIRVDPVSDARVNYVTSYCLDSSTLPEMLDKNFMLCSRRPGLGSAYLDNDRVVDHHVVNLSDQCVLSNSGTAYKVKMPRYYSTRIFNDEQRNKISDKNAKFHIKQRAKFNRNQSKWLKQHGKESSCVNMRTPYPTSPADLDLQSRKEFEQKVERKCKMKKNG